MVFHHRTMSLWSVGPGPVCATYSVVSLCFCFLLLDSFRTVSRAVHRVADFLVFARINQLDDCAVFPGFVLGFTGLIAPKVGGQPC
jgi:hypothetical protein